jgi:hypothetical protein
MLCYRAHAQRWRNVLHIRENSGNEDSRGQVAVTGIVGKRAQLGHVNSGAQKENKKERLICESRINENSQTKRLLCQGINLFTKYSLSFKTSNSRWARRSCFVFSWNTFTFNDSFARISRYNTNHVSFALTIVELNQWLTREMQRT